MNVQNVSPVFKTFSDLLGTANCFKNNPAGYLSIKRYAFNLVQHNLSSNSNCLYQNEIGIYSNQYNIYCNEVNSIGQNNAFYNKENFELFLASIFSSINFDIADESTLNLSLNLISVLSSYGIMSDIFSKQKLFIISKLNALLSNNNINKVQTNNNIESNSNNKLNVNVNVNTNSNNNNFNENLNINNNNNGINNINTNSNSNSNINNTEVIKVSSKINNVNINQNNNVVRFLLFRLNKIRMFNLKRQ